MKRKLNKWQVIIGFSRSWDRTSGYYFTLGLFKLVSFPPEAMAINKHNYKGFLWNKYVGMPNGFYLNF